jgi:hypothetical protein
MFQDKSSEMYGGEAPFSEPQSRYLRDQAKTWNPVAFVNMHSGESAVYIPWDSRATLGAGLPVRGRTTLTLYIKLLHDIRPFPTRF